MEENDSVPNRINKRPNSRPSSYYDNLKENEKPVIPDDDDFSRAIEMKNMADLDMNGKETSPTQEYLLNTTVPQNMAGIKIAGKHTPTRNSLRHSRMIVMNRNGQVQTRAYQPSNIQKNSRLATTLAAFKTLFGAAICCLAAWLLLWAPNLRRRDNPYWSGLPLLASGTFALLLMCCCKKGRRGTLRGYLVNGVKICSIMLSLIAAAVNFTASVFAIIHLITLSLMECDAALLNESCVCKLSPNSTYPVKSYHYTDLKCPQVDHQLTYLLIFSSVINFLAGVTCLWYVYTHCPTKNVYTYSKVRTKMNENNNGVIAT